MKYRRGRAPPGGNTWLFFLAIHHVQPKMKERTIPVPSTDGGRAPNDAVNVPSEEVSPNPQRSVLSAHEWLPAFSICLWKLGSILKAPYCLLRGCRSSSGERCSAPAAVSVPGTRSPSTCLLRPLSRAAPFGWRFHGLRFPPKIVSGHLWLRCLGGEIFTSVGMLRFGWFEQNHGVG